MMNVYYVFKNFKCQCINYVALDILLCIVFDDFVVYEIKGYIILNFFFIVWKELT